MRYLSIVAAAGVVALAACSDSGPGATASVNFAIATRATSAPATGPSFTEDYTDTSGNTLAIDSVIVVVRKLKLEGGAGSACVTQDTSMMHDGIETSDTGAANDGEAGDGEHECGDLKLGPFLVALPVGTAGADRQFTVLVDTGSYSEVMFQIHKPEGSRDSTFLAQHPDYAGTSVRVVGTYNGTPFVYTTAVTAVQHVEFDPPLVVGGGGANFTLFVDLTSWFRTAAGSLVDPATAIGDGANVALVTQNIIHSFHAFEDDDHDGHDDQTEVEMH